MARIPSKIGPRKDDGLFGPESVIWTLGMHPVIVLAGSRNWLYTLMFSEIAAALDEQGKVYADPRSRGQETMHWAYASVFGDTEDALRAGAWVRGMHAKVNGTDPVTRTEYSPTRPDLARFAFGIIWDSVRVGYETYVEVLDDLQREQFWQEILRTAEPMGIPVSDLPATWAQWHEYERTVVASRLNYSATSEKIMRYTRNGLGAPAVLKPAASLLIWVGIELTLATMPAQARVVIGYRRTEPRMRITRFVGRGLARVAAIPPLRNLLELAAGGRAHQLLSEARDIRKRHAAVSTTTYADRNATYA